MMYFHAIRVVSSSTGTQQCLFICLFTQICGNFFLSVDLLIIICSLLDAEVDQKLLTCGGGSNADGGGIVVSSFIFS